MHNLNMRVLGGTLLVLLSIGFGGWFIYRSFAPSKIVSANKLAALAVDPATLTSDPALKTLAVVVQDPNASFTLPVTRPDNVGKQNLFQ